MKSFAVLFVGAAFADETCSTETCAQDEATMLQLNGVRRKIQNQLQAKSSSRSATYASRKNAPYTFIHGGHCAGGWMGSNTNEGSVYDCATRCRETEGCGHFAFCEGPRDGENCDGTTNCAIYTEDGVCPDDDHWNAYDAYQIDAPFQYVHDGHCAGGWLGGNSNQATPAACSDHCNSVDDCHYFAFCEGPDGCDGSTNCALYSEQGGCPDDAHWAAYNAFETTDFWAQHEVDRSKCNKNVNLVCAANQAACQAVAEANGHPFYSFRHNSPSSGECAGEHKCFSSSHCDDGLIGDRTNEWNIYKSDDGANAYIGCFVDDGSRDLGTMRGGTNNAATNTFTLCRRECAGYQFMSLQYGGECFCSNSFGNGDQYVEVDSSECNRQVEPCSSNSFNCGGTWRQAIYEIGAVETGAKEYIGCFVDDGSRDLGTMRGGTNNAATNTFALCRAECAGFQYMSLQYGGECFCSNSIQNGEQYTRVDDSDCNRQVEPCSSNSHNCGGTWRQAIYEIGAPQGAREYIGCFVDDGSRDLGTMRGGTNNAATNTFALCREECGDSTFMSLQYGGECFCSDSYGNGDQYVQVSDFECNRNVDPCSSNSFNCGGTWRQAIYDIGR